MLKIMPNPIRKIKYTFVFILIVLFAVTGCAPVKKNKDIFLTKESLCDLSHLGRNKYFYSAHYQKKLTKSTKKIGRQ